MWKKFQLLKQGVSWSHNCLVFHYFEIKVCSKGISIILINWWFDKKNWLIDAFYTSLYYVIYEADTFAGHYCMIKCLKKNNNNLIIPGTRHDIILNFKENMQHYTVNYLNESEIAYNYLHFKVYYYCLECTVRTVIVMKNIQNIKLE